MLSLAIDSGDDGDYNLEGFINHQNIEENDPSYHVIE